MITWTQRDLPVPTWECDQGVAPWQSPTGRLFLGAWGDDLPRLLTSDDKGATIAQSLLPADTEYPFLAVGAEGVLLGLADDYNVAADTALYSADDGDSWASVTSFSAPGFLLHDGTSFIVVASSDVSYRSDDAQSWIQNPTAAMWGLGYPSAEAAADGVVLVADDINIFRSTNAGQSWTSASLGNVARGLHVRSGLYLVCGRNNTIYKSYDQGVSWVLKLPASGTDDLTQFVQIGNTILCSRSGAGAYTFRSTDGGETWTALPTAGEGTLRASNGAFFRFWSSSGTIAELKCSVDGGDTWTALTLPGALASFTATSFGAIVLGVGADSAKYWTAEFSFVSVDGAGAYSLPPIYVQGGRELTTEGRYSLPALSVSATGAIDPRFVYALDTLGVASAAPSSSGFVSAQALSIGAATSVAELDVQVLVQALSKVGIASVLESQTLAGASAITLLFVESASHDLPTAADVWALNAETGGFTRYEGFDFTSFAKVGGTYYGCKADGIYTLNGDTDAGAPIRAMLSFGKQDFGTSALKRITNAYVGVSGQGRLFLKVLAEGQEYTYAARSYDEALQVQRFDTGKGIRVNWLEFELYNADGEDFELASVEFAVVPLARRI